MMTSLALAWLALFAPAADEAAAAPDKPDAPAPTEVPEGLVIERIVAVVDTDIILLSEVEGVVDQMMQAEPPPPGADRAAWREGRRKEIVDTLVAEKLLEQQIRKLRIEVTDGEVDRVIEDTKAQHNLNDEQLRQALGQQGLSFDEYRDGLKKQLMKAKIIQLKVKNRVQVSDQDVQNQLASAKTKASKRFKVRASHMVFLVRTPEEENSARKKAVSALQRVQAGESFAEVAREVSEDRSAESGGALGTFGRGEMLPEFEEAAFSADPGAPMGPIRTQFGWHLVLVEERISLDTELTAAEQRLREELYQRELERAFQHYIDELKQKAFIEVRQAAFQR